MFQREYYCVALLSVLIHVLAAVQQQSCKITWQLHYNYMCFVAADPATYLLYLVLHKAFEEKASRQSTRSRPQAGNQVAWCPVDGWGGWGYVTKHLASSFQRHMDLHKHILLCVCRFQTHCLTQSLRLSCNELEWDQMRGRNLNYWDTPPVQTYTFTSGDFGRAFAIWPVSSNIFSSCKTHNVMVESLILLQLSGCFIFWAGSLLTH